MRLRFGAATLIANERRPTGDLRNAYAATIPDVSDLRDAFASPIRLFAVKMPTNQTRFALQILRAVTVLAQGSGVPWFGWIDAATFRNFGSTRR